MKEKLAQLVDLLAAAQVQTADFAAYGSGDEGTFEDPQYVPDDGPEPDVEDLVEEIFDAKGFNYYDGNGGELRLHVDVETRTCSWTAFVIDLVECDINDSVVAL